MLDKSTLQLLTVVDNAITLAHIETKQIQINIIDFRPTTLLSKLFEEYNYKKNTIGKSHVGLILNEPKYANFSIKSDYTRINEILNILLNNAFKFTQTGSIEFGYSTDGNTASFFVKDTGIGIPLDKQKIIFKSFAQADKDIRQSFGGLGVGLTIALGLVNALKGSINIKSQVNLGTEITFSLPTQNK